MLVADKKYQDHVAVVKHINEAGIRNQEWNGSQNSKDDMFVYRVALPFLCCHSTPVLVQA